MGRFHGWCVGVWLLLPGLAPAAEPAVPEEIWEVAHSDQVRIGQVQTTVQRLDGKRLRTTADMDLSFRRQGAAVRVRMEQGTVEIADGKVEQVFMRQFQGQKEQLVLNGTVQDGKLQVVVDGGRIKRSLRWSDDVIGLYRRLHFFEEQKPKPGDRYTWLCYEPIVNTVVTVQVHVKEREEVPVLSTGSRSGLGKRQSLLRVELTPQRIEAANGKIQLPPGVLWLDERFVPVRRQIELEGLGPIVLTRTTRALATAPNPGTAQAVDIGTKTLIPLKEAIARPYQTRSAVYRITLKEDPQPGTALVQDEHQEIRDIRKNSFELHVHPVRPGGKGEQGEPGAEYRGSSYYIDSDDSRVRELAHRAVGKVTDPWEKARLLERWVKQMMTVNNAVPMVPAGAVARDPRGDCRHYALLLAALCRAVGLPSRTAIGLIYIERRGQPPALGFHMWTEVWIDGRWLGLDATLGLGGVSATHLKICQHSWYDTRSLTPLLPVARVLGKMSIEVLQVGSEK